MTSLKIYTLLLLCWCCNATVSAGQKTKPKPVVQLKKTTKPLPQPGRLAFEFILDTRDPDSTCLKVIHVLPNSPAEKAGLRANMLITAIDHIPTWNKTIQQLAGMLAGNAGTKVTCSVTILPLYVKQEITMTREVYDMDTITGNTTRGKEALARKDIPAAVSFFKKAKGGSEAALLLASIYSGYYLISTGATDHPDEPGNKKLISTLQDLADADSAHAWLDPLVQEGYPKAYTLMSQLYDRDCVLFPEFEYYKPSSPYRLWLYAAADAGDLTAQDLLLSELFYRTADVPHDVSLAGYWVKRAILQGSNNGEAYMKKLSAMDPAPDVSFMSLYDLRKMMEYAHQYLGDAQYYYSVSKMNPYGIGGFLQGNYDSYLANFNEGALRLTWRTHTVTDEALAKKIFQYMRGLLNEYILAVDHPGSDEFSLTEYMGTKPEDSYMIKFTAKENDGKTYPMELGIALTKGSRGYYVELFYENQEK